MNSRVIRELRADDAEAIENIFALYWDAEFQERLMKRLRQALANDQEAVESRLRYFIAEENGELVGVIGIRKCPEHMAQHASTANPCEFYIIAVKTRGRGIGRELFARAVQEAKAAGYSEALGYSAESHKDSWDFHERSGFTLVGPALAPNGEPGRVYRLDLK